MAEKFRFMDPVQLPDGTYDREYNAQEFTDYFKVLVTTGVMKSVGNQLAVSANGANMVTRIDTGLAFILGRYYENDSFKEHTHDTETLGNSRIDRIVVRMDLSPDKRHVLSFVKKGAPSPNPVPPQLTQTATIYEISLAQVRIVGGQTFIATNAVTDERGKDIICPWAGSNILPSYNDNALANLQREFTTHQEDIDKHLRNGERTKWDKLISNLGFGLELRTSILDWCNSQTQNANIAITTLYSPSDHPTNGEGFIEVVVANNGRKTVFFTTYKGDGYNYVYLRPISGNNWAGDWSRLLNNLDYDQLFTSVSNGKSAIANAITGKGIYTAPNAEFATMANNISNIQTGRKEARGTVSNFTSGSNRMISIQGLGFRPKIALLARQTGPIDTLSFRTVYVDGSTFSPSAGNINQYAYDNPNTSPQINVVPGALVSVTDSSIDLIVAQNVYQLDPNLTFSYIVLG